MRNPFVPALAWLVLGAAASAPPTDFSGRWSADPPAMTGGRGDMGSGWGSPITITQDAQRLMVEYAFFGRGDMQPPLKFVYALDGSETRNSVMMGRGVQVQSSKAAGTATRSSSRPRTPTSIPPTGKPATIDVKQILSLESPTTLVVETTRAACSADQATRRGRSTKKTLAVAAAAACTDPARSAARAGTSLSSR